MAFGQFGDLSQGIGGLSPMDLNFQASAAPAAVPAGVSGIAGTGAAPGTQGIGSWFSNLFGGSAGAPGGVGQIGGTGGSSGLLGMGQLGLSGLGTLASLYTGLGALNLAKQQFNFSKGMAQTNLANETKSYNTALSDKANARYVTEGKPQSEADAYIAANKL